MIKAIFTALTGIDDSMESPEAQAQWERHSNSHYEDFVLI